MSNRTRHGSSQSDLFPRSIRPTIPIDESHRLVQLALELDWTEVEALYEGRGLPPQVPAMASRVHVPVYRDGAQVGRATSTTWSPVLKKMIALGSVASGHAQTGTSLGVEFTIEAVRHRVSAKVVDLPFFNPPRKTATPVV